MPAFMAIVLPRSVPVRSPIRRLLFSGHALLTIVYKRLLSPTTMSESLSKSISPSPGPSSGPVNRHAPTAVEKQRMQLEKLLKDPSKPAYIPPPPKEKTIRPPREMMKNVQGSSAGAGSGEFHVYKASRRREYERTKLMEEKVEKVCERCGGSFRFP